jgi:hypothetical protein
MHHDIDVYGWLVLAFELGMESCLGTWIATLPGPNFGWGIYQAAEKKKKKNICPCCVALASDGVQPVQSNSS